MMIALVAVIFLQDRLAGSDPAPPDSTLAGILQGLALLIGITAIAALRLSGARRLLDRTGRAEAIARAERVLGLAPMLIVLAHCINVLFFDWLDAIRAIMGDRIFLDEAVATLPPLLAIVFVWYMYYPIEKRVRQALLIRHLDRSLPVPPAISRGHYVVLQIRHQFLLTLLPLALILLWVEIVDVYIVGGALDRFAIGLQIAGVIAVFLIAPVLIRHAWDTVPLAEGELREDLVGLCRRYGARVREILVWRTHGNMINGAVMGVIPPLRYILLTDGLIESMSDRHIEAVMAHEIGHIKRKHLPTMVALLIVCVSTAAFLIGLVLQYAIYTSMWWWIVTPEFIRELLRRPELRFSVAEIDVAVTISSLIIGLMVFGYLSRRFERQADTFAVQHLSVSPPREQRDDGLYTEPMPVGTEEEANDTEAQNRSRLVEAGDGEEERRSSAGVVTAEAARAMAGALEAVARLNHIPPERKSWRHGSIRWRQRYLMSLVGQPLENLRIDRQIRRLRLITIIGVVLVLAVVAYDFLNSPLLTTW